jgi:hypothetical protein
MATATTLDGGTYFDVEEHYHQSEAWECAMTYLDKKEVARFDANTEAEYSLVGRIERYCEAQNHLTTTN